MLRRRLRSSRILLLAALLVPILPGGPATGAARAEAPDFALRDLDGKQVRLSELRGRIVVLNFWFKDCPPCRAERPELNQLVNAHRDQEDVVFLGLSTDPERALRAFLTDHPFLYKNFADADPVADLYEVEGFPTHVVIDTEGRVAARFQGATNARLRLARIIEQLKTNVPVGEQPAHARPVRPSLPPLPPELKKALADLEAQGRPDAVDAIAHQLAIEASLVGSGPARVIAGCIRLEAATRLHPIHGQARMFPGGLFVTSVPGPGASLEFGAAEHFPTIVRTPYPDAFDVGWVDSTIPFAGIAPTFSGRVLDEHGVPLSGIRVAATTAPLTAPAARHRSAPAQTPPLVSTLTDRQGRFQLRANAPGQHELAILPPGTVGLRRAAYAVAGAIELGDIALERALAARIRCAVKERGSAPHEQVFMLREGDRWRPFDPDRFGYLFAAGVEQRGGMLWLEAVYGAEFQAPPDGPSASLSATPGRLFELRHSQFGHAASCEVLDVGPAPKGALNLAEGDPVRILDRTIRASPGCSLHRLGAGAMALRCGNVELAWMEGDRLDPFALPHLPAGERTFQPCTVLRKRTWCSAVESSEPAALRALQATALHGPDEIVVRCTWSGPADLPELCRSVLIPRHEQRSCCAAHAPAPGAE